MDPLMQFFTWQFMLFSLSVAGATFVLRLVVEYFVTAAKPRGLWENLVLPIFPLGLGMLLGLVVTTYPYPDGLVGKSGHVFFGVVAGMFSGIVYRVIKAMLNAKIAAALAPAADPNNPNPMPAPAPAPAPLPLPPPPAPGGNVMPELVDSVRDSIRKQP